MLLVAVSALLAPPLTMKAGASGARLWTLSNVALSDGGAMTGSFALDSAGAISNVDVSVSGGDTATWPAITYVLGYPQGYITGNPQGSSSFDLTDSSAFTRYAMLTLPDLSSATTGQTLALPLNHVSWDCQTNCGPGRYVVAGSVVAGSATDSTPPVITPTVTPSAPDGDNGWYVGDPQVSFAVTDAESPVSSTAGCDSTTVTTDAGGQLFTCSATSGGGTSAESVTVARDATPPVISGADVQGTTWRNTPLSVPFTASDATSGLADARDSSFTLTASAESADSTTPTTVSRTVPDAAGNSSTRTLSALIDVTAPVVTVSHTADGSNGWNITSPVTETVSASDALSGVAGRPTCTVDAAPVTLTSGTGGGWSFDVAGDGNHAVSCAATDTAGNVGSADDATLIGTTPPTLSVGHSIDGLHGWNITAPVIQTVTAAAGASGLSAAPTCTVDGVAASTSSSLAGTWQFAVGGDRVHALTCSVTDAAGHRVIETDTTRIDTAPPTVAVSAGTTTPGATVTVTVTAADAGSGLAGAPTCTVDGAVVATTGGASSATFDISGTSSHAVSCAAVDVAGNTGTVTRTVGVVAPPAPPVPPATPPSPSPIDTVLPTPTDTTQPSPHAVTPPAAGPTAQPTQTSSYVPAPPATALPRPTPTLVPTPGVSATTTPPTVPLSPPVLSPAAKPAPSVVASVVPPASSPPSASPAPVAPAGSPAPPIPPTNSSPSGAQALPPADPVVDPSTGTRPAPQPGKAFALLDGAPTSATVQVVGDKVDVTSGPLALKIEAIGSDGTVHTPGAGGALLLDLGGTVDVQASGFAPGAGIALWGFSKPVRLGSAVANANGTLHTTVRIPRAMGGGHHTLQINGLSRDGARSLSLGLRIDATGLAVWQPLDHVGEVTSTQVAFFAIAGLAAVGGASTLGSSLGLRGSSGGAGAPSNRGAGGRAATTRVGEESAEGEGEDAGEQGGEGHEGGEEGGEEGDSEQDLLEALKGQEEAEEAHTHSSLEGFLDRHLHQLGTRADRVVANRTRRTWQWPGHRVTDRVSVAGPRVVARWSSLTAKLLSDGVHVRASFGSLWALLVLTGVAVGVVAGTGVDAAGAPQVAWVAVAVAVGTIDAFAGLAAAAAFVLTCLILGPATADAVRGSAGVASLFFVLPLLANEARPLRRPRSHTTIALWHRVGDFLVLPPLGAWLVWRLVKALPALYGHVVPISEHAGFIGIVAGLAVLLRLCLEEHATWLHPDRLDALAAHEGPAPSLVKSIIGILAKAVFFLFVAAPFVGVGPALAIGGVLFLLPAALALTEHRLPRQKWLGRALPTGAVKITALMVAGYYLSRLLSAHVTNQTTLITLGFIVLSVPPCLLGSLELLRDEGHAAAVTWRQRFLGTAAILLCAYAVLSLSVLT